MNRSVPDGMKKTIWFLFAAMLSLIAAAYRFGDSGHAVGLISRDGGRVRHPCVFTAGKPRYVQITTATVIPPYRGDVRIILEGEPAMDYDIFFSEPVIPLEKKRSPVFKGDTLFNLKPFDRISLWVVMHPNRNMDTTRTSFEADPPSDSLQDLAASRTTVESSYRLAFYDQHSGKRVLAIPFLFKPMEAPHEAIAASR